MKRKTREDFPRFAPPEDGDAAQYWADGYNECLDDLATPVMASPTPSNLDRIRWAFAEFRKDACVSGDDRVSEAFIKAGLTLLGAVGNAEDSNSARKLAERALHINALYYNTNCNPAGFRLSVESLAEDARKYLASTGAKS